MNFSHSRTGAKRNYRSRWLASSIRSALGRPLNTAWSSRRLSSKRFRAGQSQFMATASSRVFGYVGDVVKALMALMEHPDAVGQVFNIGYDEEITISELAEIVKVLTGSQSEIVLVPYDEAYEEGFEDMPRRVPDISKVRDLIGFRPTLKLEDIVKAVIDYYRPLMITSFAKAAAATQVAVGANA